MCAGCMNNADMLLTSGIIGAASIRVGARRFLPTRRWTRPVTDGEAADFVASIGSSAPAPSRTDGSLADRSPLEPAGDARS